MFQNEDEFTELEKATQAQMEDAYSLWLELLSGGCNSTIASECGGDLSCFFCREWYNGTEEVHSPNCIYVRAIKVLKG